MNEVVSLNVGGYFYTTTRDTLTQPIGTRKDPHIFNALLGGNFYAIKDAQGNLFIDRDGKNFGYLLNYMRNGGELKKTQLPWNDQYLIQEIQYEAEFFGLTELVQKCSDYFVQKQKTFNSNNCHPNLCVDRDGTQLRCTQATGKNWYSVRADQPLITSEEMQNGFDQSSMTTVDMNYLEIQLDNTHNYNVVMGISKLQTSYFYDCWTVGFIDHSYGFNVWSKKKYHKKQQMDYGERCERGDRVGMLFDWKEKKIFYFRNGKSLGCAFSGIDLGKPTDKWFFVVSLYNENDIISIVQDAEKPHPPQDEDNSINATTNSFSEVFVGGNAIAHRGALAAADNNYNLMDNVNE
ncbi:KCTD13 [Acrasis kona]|uniref:KCTD13 n=1 Tax=Acrasis kona TaxID=1008807 RepID=A0AAW2Z7L8_9EUKA